MGEFSWAYISGGGISSSGPTGSLQFRVPDAGSNTSISGSSELMWHTASSMLAITGSVEIVGTLTANQYNVNVIDKTVTNISASGDTIFGDTADDTHQFTGSVYVNGPLSAAANISASAFYGDGSTLTGISATSMSGASGQFNTLSGLLITSGNVYLGDGASDITTIAGQLTASQGALFGERVMIVDDKSLVFGNQGDSIIRYDEAGSDALVVSGSSTGLWLGGGSVIIDSAVTQITGAIELTGSGQSLLTLHARDADALKEIVFLKDGATAAAIQINSSEHLFIENENAKDIILRTNNQNALRVIGSQRKVIVGAVSKTSANAELDVEGNAIVSGTLTTTDDINLLDDKKLNLGDSADALIEYDSGIGRLVISGSAIGMELVGGNIGVDYPGGTVVSGTAGGAGSFLALNSSHQVVVATPAPGDPFPYTGNVAITGTLTTTDDINLLDDKKLNLGDSADALIEYDSGIGRLVISGSAIGMELVGGNIGVDYPGGTVVSGTAGGAGSFLALNSSHQVVVATPAGGGSAFPYTGNIVGTGSLTIVSGSTQVLEVDSSDEGLGAVRGRMVQHIRSGFTLSSGSPANTGRWISLGGSPATVASGLSNSNVMITPFSGRLISVTYHFPAGASKQDPSKGQPQWELWVGDVNALKGQSLSSAVSIVAQATASSWPGELIVGGFNVQSGQGTLGGTNTTGSWSFGTGSVVALKFKSGDASNNNYPGQSVMTTVWEFDQLDPYISGSGN
jgi:hypothetical protein